MTVTTTIIDIHCTDVYSPRRQKQRKEIEQVDSYRGQNLQSNRDIQLISTSIIKTQTSKKHRKQPPECRNKITS